ncbi:MAG: hypothetical protein J6B74_06350 [Ruminococcus sp.]|nr:hypothetical protein [Ruminococcus sp.]
MRKLVSAATSLVMAATMVSAVAPVVAGAADARKGLSILAYKEATLPEGVTADGATVTVSADAIKSGDVVVPLGIYLSEETPDTKGIAVKATVNSDNADVKNIKFNAYQPGADTFFGEAKTFTTKDGTEFTTDKVVSFAGSYAKRGGYMAHGKYTIAVDDKQDAAGTPNAYIGLAWNNNGSKYKDWFGEKSDDYPIVVFDVILPKGTSEGTYTIDYCNYVADKVPSNLLETVEWYDTFEHNNLDLNNLTIKIGDSASGTTTTTTTPADTTTTTTTNGNDGTTTTTTTKKDDDNPVSGDFVVDLVNPDSEDGYWHANAGDTEVFVDAHITTNTEGLKVAGFSFDLTVEGGIKLVDVVKKCPALNNSALVSDYNSGNVNGTSEGKDGDGLTIEDGPLFYYTFEVPEGTPDGLYEINFTKALLLKADKTPHNVGVKKGYIQVGEGGTTTTTTTTKPDDTTTTTTKATTTTTTNGGAGTTTTSTTKTPAPGAPVYGDTNCDNQVKINDVVLLNKYLNDAKSYNISDQGKLNADCYNPKNGEELTAEDSKAIIQSIVHLVELPVNK